MAAWWKKLRRAWGAVKAGLQKSRNGENKKSNTSGGGNSTNYTEEEGRPTKLRSDAENSHYKEAHAFWNILEAETAVAPSSSSSSSSSSSLASTRPPTPSPVSSPATTLISGRSFFCSRRPSAAAATAATSVSVPM